MFNMRAMNPLFRIAAVLGIGASVLAACGEQQTPAQQYLRNGDREALDRGKQLFTGMCGAYCHSFKADNREAPYLFDCDWKHGGTDQEVFSTIYGGVPKTQMLAFGGKLPDEDIWKVIAFLRAASRCGR